MKRKTQGLACLAGGLLLTSMAAPMAGPTTSPRAPAAPGNAQAEQAAARQHSPDNERISPADARRLQQIIRRERQRYGHLLPQPGMTGPMLDAKQPLHASSNNQWVNIGPFNADYARYGDVVLKVTDAGDVADFATDPLDPNVLYAAFDLGGLWKSMDGGNSWRPKIEHLSNLSAAAIAIDRNDSRRIFLGQHQVLGGAKVIRSVDGGETWTEGPALANATEIFNLMLVPQKPNSLLAATDRGLFISTDGAVTFSRLPIGEVSEVWRNASIAWAGNDTLVVGTGVRSTQRGSIWRSIDSGTTWSEVNGIDAGIDISLFTVASAPSHPSVVYAIAGTQWKWETGADLAEIFRSSDGGATWTGIARESGAFKPYINANVDAPHLGTLLNGAGDYRQALVVDPSNPDRAFFGGGNLIAATDDGGQTFRQVSDHRGKWSLPYVHATANAMHFAANGSLYIGSTGGLARSDDGGLSWTQTLNRGLATHSIWQLCSGGRSGEAMITNSFATGMRVRAGATGTFNQERFTPGYGCIFDPSDMRTALWSGDHTLILKTKDGGKTWNKSCAGIEGCDDVLRPNESRLWSVTRDGVMTLYTQSNDRLYRSVDFGDSWQQVTPGEPMGYLGAFAVSPVNPHLLAARKDSNFLLSQDGGMTWQIAPTSAPFFMHTIEFDPAQTNTLYAASRTVSALMSHIWRSTDFGQTWKPIDLGGFPTGIHVYDLIADPGRPGTLYAGTFLGVYRSTDRGDTWQRFGQGLPMVRVYDLSLTPDGNTLHVGTGGRGVWEIALTDNGGDDGLQNGVPLKDLAGAKASEQFWTMTVPANASTLRFVTTGGSGDADLYVKFGSKPSATSYDCRSNSSSNSESCVIGTPQAGTYHVMLRGWSAYSGVSLTGSYSTVARTAYANDTDTAIIDRGSVSSAITVAGRNGKAPSDTQVEVDIRHSYRGDLKVELLAPDGSAYLLHDRKGGSADDLRQTYTVDLSNEAISGEWKLRVTDLAPGDTGHIDRWSITL